MNNLEPVGLWTCRIAVFFQCHSISHDLIPKIPGLYRLPNWCLLIYTETEVGNRNFWVLNCGKGPSSIINSSQNITLKIIPESSLEPMATGSKALKKHTEIIYTWYCHCIDRKQVLWYI